MVGRLSSPRLLSFLADNDNGGERFNQATAEEGSVKEGWDCFTWAHETAELTHVLDRDVSVLSGGELQRFAIAAVAVKASDVYMFDEPSSYSDVKQRLTAVHMIRQLLDHTELGDRRYVMVV